MRWKQPATSWQGSLDMRPSQKFSDILNEMVEEGQLAVETREQPGRYPTKFYSLIETTSYHELFSRRSYRGQKSWGCRWEIGDVFMRKSISQARIAYDKTYRRMRLQNGHYQEEEVSRGVSDAQECAMLSYDNQYEHFSGWRNTLRHHRWFYRKTHVYRTGDLPF